MRRTHVLLALLTVVVWGVNFVVVDAALVHVPPLLFAALRFTFVAVPGVFLVPRPKVPVRWIVAVGLFLGAGQFGLLFVGMARGAPAGLASLVLQAQAVFTLAFAALVLRERPTVRQLAGVGTATAGLVVIAVGRGAGTPLLALLLVVAAAACWGAGNVCTRLARAGNGLSLVVWSALVPPVPLAVLSLLVEGPAADARAFATVSWSEVGALLYVVVLASLVGYGTWTMLLREYPASTVAPLSLLVPVVGIAAAWLLDGETPGPAELAGAAVVLAGLALVSVRRRPEVRPLVQAREERVRG